MTVEEALKYLFDLGFSPQEYERLWIGHAVAKFMPVPATLDQPALPLENDVKIKSTNLQ